MDEADTDDTGAGTGETITFSAAIGRIYQASEAVRGLFSPWGLVLVLCVIVAGNMLTALFIYVAANLLGIISSAFGEGRQWAYGVVIGVVATLLADVLKVMIKALAKRP